MSTEMILRRAAALMREDADTRWHAVANWLDTAGADLWAYGPLCCDDGCMECDDDLWRPHVRRAFAVARVYLGESSS